MPNNGYFDTVFASSGDVTSVPDATQPDGTVSYAQGFPILYSTPVSSGGYNVPRSSMNQIFKDMTGAIQDWQQNTIAPAITSAMNGGSPYSYSKYNMVRYGGVGYMSLENSNTDLPPSSKWVEINFRPALTANTSFYVATTGSDSNPGTVGSPWLTLQHAMDYLQGIDLAGYTATVNVADGTYTAGIYLNAPFTGGDVRIQGNLATPANVVISATSEDCIYLQGNAYLIVLGGFSLQTTTSGRGINVTDNASCRITGLMRYGACASDHLMATASGTINIDSNYTITAGANYHWYALGGRISIVTGNTVTLSGTPAFSQAFAGGDGAGTVQCAGLTFSGSATGVRYVARSNSVINTNGGGGTYLPGDSAGSTASGGQYL